jgi:hypothetical protein
LPIIPNRCNATKKAYCPKRFYRRRHKIENFFCRIKDPPSSTAPANHRPIRRNHGSAAVSTRVLQHNPPESVHAAGGSGALVADLIRIDQDPLVPTDVRS